MEGAMSWPNLANGLLGREDRLVRRARHFGQRTGLVLLALVLTVAVGIVQEPLHPATAAASPPNVVAGQPIALGTAAIYGSVAGMTLVAPIVGMAATPSGNGYWLVAADGGIFAFGDAGFHGSTGALRLNRPIVGMAATPSGNGYWLGAADGGIFAFGDARFHGSTGALRLNRPIVGMAATPSGNGYWLVAADGGIFAFGDAPYWGSMGGTPLVAPVVSMAVTPSGHGYWLAAADGGIFAFGDAQFLGSIGGQALADPIAAIVATPDGEGLWLLPVPPPPLPVGGPSVAGAIISNLSDIPGNVYPRGTKVAALTFDDGPSPVYTAQILQVLTQYHVPATFQIVGFEGAAYPNLLVQEVADGMTLTNHTWDHTDLTKLSPAGWPGEVDRTTNLITTVTGEPVKCVRPPYGATNDSVYSQLAQRGLGELLWDVDPPDYLSRSY